MKSEREAKEPLGSAAERCQWAPGANAILQCRKPSTTTVKAIVGGMDYRLCLEHADQAIAAGLVMPKLSDAGKETL